MSATRVRRTLTLACLLTGALAGRAPAQAGDFAGDTRSYLSRLEKLGFAGVVLVAQDGVPIVADGYGLADRKRGIRWNPAVVSTVGSITKQFTAAAILTLEEAGRLHTTDTITRYFPDVPADKRGITLHQLLTHSSGITDLDGADDWDPIGREEFIRRAMAQPLAFPPGQGYEYSNAGYSLLGAILEQVTGESWEQYVRARLFLPQRMYQTGYILPRWGEGQLAQGYRAGVRWGTVLERPLDRDGPYWVLRANGGVHAPAWDMLRWAEALVSGQVLSPASMEKLWTPYVDEGGGSHYGYGWAIHEFAGAKVVTHNGGNGIHYADFAIVPSARLVVFLQTNVIADVPVANELLQQIGARLMSGTPYPLIPDVIAMPDSALAALAGRYRLAGSGGTFRVTAFDGHLVAEAEGQQAFHLLHSSRVVDTARAARLVTLTDRFVAGWRRGDLAEVRRLQPGDVPLDRMAQGLTAWVADREGTLGKFQDYQVLGAALQETREMVVVRFRFERGSADRAYVWDLGEQSRMLGVSDRGLRTQLALMPTGPGRFATWDGGLTASRQVTFERGRVTLDALGQTVTGTR